ncbi:MAG TPA: hypothetical protein VMI30_11810, partial [Stellaceae bacterium]|nr:hypothetical protein [Stellaceae bacterium]
MSSTQGVLSISSRPRRPGGRWSHWARHLHGSEYAWAIAFAVPYAAVLLVFGVYPIVYGLWTASDPALYAQLFASDDYIDAVVTTLIYVGVGVNIDMFLALLLSGYFMRKEWWVKAL